MAREWVEWHRAYEGDHPHARRLEAVRTCIRRALDGAPPGPIRAVSLCAGDGRDLLGVLEGHPRATDVVARLIDLEPELVAAGRKHAGRLGLGGIEFVEGDASNTRACVGAVPADLVLVCGIFGNVRDEDVRNTIDHLPELCAPGATVVWTRGRFPPDLTPTIRRWYREAGFDELAFVPIPDTTASVGANRLVASPRPLRAGLRLFTFLPKEERPSSRRASTPDKHAGAGR